jgi:general secretion pathway protein D
MKSSKLCKPAPFMLLALCVAIAGCGSSGVRKDSAELMKEGQYEAGIARLEEALRENPRDTELNIALAHGRQPGADPRAEQPPRPGRHPPP